MQILLLTDKKRTAVDWLLKYHKGRFNIVDGIMRTHSGETYIIVTRPEHLAGSRPDRFIRLGDPDIELVKEARRLCKITEKGGEDMRAFEHGEVVQFKNGTATYKVCDARSNQTLTGQYLQELGTDILYPMPDKPLSRLFRVVGTHEPTVDEIFGDVRTESIKNFRNSYTKGETTVNKTIEKIFAESPSKDEKLMQKHFGKEIPDNFTGELILEEKKAEYLQEAKRREAAEKSEKEGGQE